MKSQHHTIFFNFINIQCNVYSGPPQEVNDFRRCLSEEYRLSLCWNAPHILLGEVLYRIRADSLTRNMTTMKCQIIETNLTLGTTQCDNTFGSQYAPYNYSVTPILNTLSSSSIFYGPTSSILIVNKG